MSTPTQVRRPWRATMRTTFQLIIGIAVLLPFVVQASGLSPEVYPWLGGLLAVAAAVTRVMALPQVEDFLQRFAPWLAAEKGSDLGEGGFASLTFPDRPRYAISYDWKTGVTTSTWVDRDGNETITRRGPGEHL